MSDESIDGVMDDQLDEPWEGLYDLMVLVMDKPPGLATAAGWTYAQKVEVERWALAEHMAASDNPTRRWCSPVVLGMPILSALTAGASCDDRHG